MGGYYIGDDPRLTYGKCYYSDGGISGSSGYYSDGKSTYYESKSSYYLEDDYGKSGYFDTKLFVSVREFRNRQIDVII